MSPSEYKPKLSIEITFSQQEALRAINLPHGWQRAIFSEIIDEIIALADIYGPEALAIMIARQARPASIIPSLTRIVKENTDEHP